MIEGVILDLDGTVYHGDRPVDGAPEFIRRLRAGAVPFVFATNRANRTPQTIAGMLQGYGLDCLPSDVVTASIATAEHLEPKGTVFVVGEDALRQALTEAGFEEVEHDPDYVVVGLDRGLTYAKLNTAARSIRRRSRFVATNPDLLVNAGDGEKDIGNGVVVAALALASGKEPLVIGKPHAPLFDAALKRLGGGSPIPRDRVLVVGDNLKTDVDGGIRAGLRTALIYTGISEPADVERSGVRPDFEVHGYDELADVVWGRSSS